MNHILIIMALILAPEAFAKKSKRTGFNFGTTVRALDDSRMTGDEDVTIQSQSSKAVSPYVGYAFSGYFNLGLSIFIEENTLKWESEEGGRSLTVEDTTSIRGGMIFSRLLFGKFFFLEAGIGGAHGTVRKATTIVENNTLSETESTQGGAGIGYQAGGGLEAPIGLGFYFTSAFYHRSLDLRDVQSNQKLATSKSEFVFGLAHYLK